MSYEACLARIGSLTAQPFSLAYNGETVVSIDRDWNLIKETSAADGGERELYERVYCSPDGMIALTVSMTEFLDTGALEWILYLENVGDQKAPALSGVLPLHVKLPVSQESLPSILYSRGCFPQDSIANYAMQNQPLFPGTPMKLESQGGKSVDTIPFFNLCQDGGGLIGGVGWPGKWVITAERTAQDAVTLTAGMAEMNIALLPNERIRTPRILLMPWKGDWIDAQNRLRRHNLAYHTPHYGGKPVELPVCHGGWGGMKRETAKKLMDQIVSEKMPYDAFWMDAGWYGEDREVDEYQVFGEEDWFLYAGDWRENKTAHPDGLAAISREAHRHGLKFLLWYEPERVVIGTPLSRTHPEWIIGDRGTAFGGHKDRPYVRYGLFNFGNPEARAWMTDWISTQIEEIGIDIYRQDCNDFDLSYFWTSVDVPDRRGMTEIRYVEGLLAFWDELRRRPNLILDVVQRADLDTITRAVDLSRSDYPIAPDSDPVGNQVATQGLAFWRPHYGTLVTTLPEDTYHMRSAFCPGLSFAITDLNGTREQLGMYARKPFPFAWGRRIMEQLRKARPYYYGDYYPLTVSSIRRNTLFGAPFGYAEPVTTLERTGWFAYQMHRQDLEEGMVMILRRPESPYCTARFALRGLRPGTVYVIEDADTGQTVELPAEQLQSGLEVSVAEQPGSKLLFYRADPS